MTGEVQAAHAAFVRGDYAGISEISLAARTSALEPGQAVSLMLMQSSGLMGRGARAEAEKLATEAVTMLRPIAPCTLLGDALFQLGVAQPDAGEMIRLWEEAAIADLDCELNLSAAQRYMNMAEVLSQPGKTVSLPSGRTAEHFFEQAEKLIGAGRDLESIVLRGSLAQRRGLAAFRAGDFDACGKHFTEAENRFRSVGRNADLAFTLGQQGLALFHVARKNRSLQAFAAALGKFEEASALFQRQDLLGEQFRMERMAGAVSWEAGSLAAGAERERLYEAASRHMSAAAASMELLRKGRQERELFDRQSSLDDIAALMSPFLEEAFRFHLNVLRRPAEALGWLEKGKTRGLLNAVAASHGAPAPPDADPALAAEEGWLETERRGITDNGYAARKRWKELTISLERLWKKMSEQPASAAYAALRLGLPMDWPRWQLALQEQSTLPEAAGRAVLSVHFVWPRNESDPIRLIACRSDWDAPKMAAAATPCRRVESFLLQCFGGPGRSSLTSWLRMAGGDAAWGAGISRP